MLERLKRLACLPLLALLLSGCGSFLRLDAPPAEATEGLPVLGIPNARFWPDARPEALRREVAEMIRREQAQAGGRPLGPAHLLALSGGGDNGAFGAGLMQGWTESGTRPEFNVVTGISAGALIAPFAFLGPAYDAPLRDVFVGVAPTDVLIIPRTVVAAFSILFGEAVADTSPLSRLIERHANNEMLAAIAAEYAKGRMLLIGTTNLDMQRPVVWNIGAIAASGHPQALDLFRRILLASASIPGAFPPVLIEVEQEGRRFQEMHVDGGAASQVFLYPAGVRLVPGEIGRRTERPRTAHVIRNGRVDVEASSATRGVFSIASRAASTLLHFSGLSDIDRIYLTTQRDGIAFRVAYIGSDFRTPRSQPFDPVYMQALFDYGVAAGREGTRWRSVPSEVSTIPGQP